MRLALQLVEAGEPGDWRELALCREIDGDLWFPELGESVREAKAVCGRCPVRAECLDYALAHNEVFGVWGGLSVLERRALRRGPTPGTQAA